MELLKRQAARNKTSLLPPRPKAPRDNSNTAQEPRPAEAASVETNGQNPSLVTPLPGHGTTEREGRPPVLLLLDTPQPQQESRNLGNAPRGNLENRSPRHPSLLSSSSSDSS